MSNIHSQTVPEEIVRQAIQKFNEGHDLLRPYLCPLSSEERQTLFKMGDKSLAFVEKAAEQAQANPQLCPPYFNLEELNIDLADAVNLRKVTTLLQQITRDTDDTVMIAGSEAIGQALTFYNSVKQAVRDKISGAPAVFEELKKRFTLGRPKSSVAQ
jgi:hypothetical protein